MKNTARIQRKSVTKPAPDQIQTPAIPASPKFVSNDIFDELSGAKAQSAALHMLLLDVLSTKDDGGTYGEEINYGISELMLSTHQRMDRVVESVEALLMQKAGGAA